MKILVTGAGGMVGSYVPEVFDKEELLLTDIGEGSIPLDVRDPQAVKTALASYGPDLVLHLAAATDVDRCQQQPDWAFHTNAVGTQNIVMGCLAEGVELVYISTGSVFSGEKAEPYTEFDAPQPSNVYAHSKLAGEQIVSSFLKHYYIVRAGWMIGGGKKDKKFVGKIAQLLRDGKNPLSAVNDKWGSPTYAKDMLNGIRELIKTGYYGLYHMANKGICSRYEIACEIQRILQRPDLSILPVSSEHFPLPAPRGRSEALRNCKLELLGLNRMRPWQEALREYVEKELIPR